MNVYKKELDNRYEIRIINTKTGEFSSYHQDKNIGFIYGLQGKTTVEKMGYTNINECIKTLKSREFLGIEVDYKDQKESERMGYIKLGVERIKRAGRINYKDFEDVARKLIGYGMGLCDAEECIVQMYLHSV